MNHYLLDTNIVSHIIRGDSPSIRARLEATPMQAIAISAVTQGELAYGVAKRGHPPGLSARVQAFLARVKVLPWTSAVADVYGALRARCESRGTPLGALDMMIAAQGLTLHQQAQVRGDQATLVSRDRAFAQLAQDMAVEDWQ